MKKAILVAIIGAMTLGVNAGDWGKAPVMDKMPIEECYDIGGSISAGYDTDYVFYGARFWTDSVWTDVNYTFDSLWAPINVGVWYINGTNQNPAVVGGTDELDLYASVGLGSFAGFDFTLGYTHFFFPEASFQSYGEIGLDMSYSTPWFDILAEANYALSSLDPPASDGDGGWYYQFGIERGFDVTDTVALVLGAGVGYADNYFSAGKVAFPSATRNSGWSHYYITASLPIELNCRAVLSPYITYIGAPDTFVHDGTTYNAALGPQSDVLYGGISLSVSF